MKGECNKMKDIFKRKTLITEEQVKDAKKWFNIAYMFESFQPEEVDWKQKASECRDYGAKALGFTDYDDFTEFKKLICTLG